MLDHATYPSAFIVISVDRVPSYNFGSGFECYLCISNVNVTAKLIKFASWKVDRFGGFLGMPTHTRSVPPPTETSTSNPASFADFDGIPFTLQMGFSCWEDYCSDYRVLLLLVS